MDISLLNIPKNKISQFEKKGITSLESLLSFIPRKYLDYRNPSVCKNLEEGMETSIIGTVTFIKNLPDKKMFFVKCVDENNETFEVCWFGKVFGLDKILVRCKYIFCGKIQKNSYSKNFQLVNPIFSNKIDEYKKILPVYSKIQGMSDEYLKNCINKAVDNIPKNDNIEFLLRKKFDIISNYDMIRYLHFPNNFEEIEKAKKRLLFNSLFELAFGMEKDKNIINNKTSICLKNMTSVTPFLKTLPFSLTDGPESQLETVRSIVRKINKGFVTTSLVQGDVGCGKTFVALLLMLLMAENNFQSVLMAPTNVLAIQHYEDISNYLKDVPFVKTCLLTAGLKKKEKDKILNDIKEGNVNIIIGTHSVLSDNVEYKNLGLGIVDEEHRFGVSQRNKIKEKVMNNVHFVTMSATPIPRTLGISLYGDGTDIYTITQMPAGRKKVITSVSTDIEKSYDFILNQINDGRQAYIVCPLIEESTSEKMAEVDSVEKTFKEANDYFSKYPHVRIGVVNGKMKQDQIAEELDKFVNHEYDIMISTTIIEVGVNVPNSSIIVIKNAERFGLAQLHQLRGRVGRGQYQSYCVLNTIKEDVERLNVLSMTNDGFRIAEEDLRLRGMGDFLGTKQSGEVQNVMLMIANPKLYSEIKAEVKEILKDEKRFNRYLYLSQ